jgi:hypothetical protein
MMLTRDQAAEVWCPMVRVPAPASTAAYNRAQGTSSVSTSCRCIADKCAMWRWGTYVAPPPDAEPGKVCVGIKYQSDVGYCGLAGAPLIGGAA